MTLAQRSDGWYAIAEEQPSPTHTILQVLRTHAPLTRPDIVRATGLGRNVVAHEVEALIGLGLVEQGEVSATGGRPARELRARAEAGMVLVAELGATTLSVAAADLTGRIRAVSSKPSDLVGGPRQVLARVIELFDDLLIAEDTPLWGIGVGLPGPVEFDTGTPIAPPIMPGWDGYDVRAHFTDHFPGVPVWVDNDVNVMALGELRDGLARGVQDLVYVKIGTGIGAGLVSGGILHRGSQGCAGDIGHMSVDPHSSVVCRCGQTGCLEAVAGGAALARQASSALTSGEGSMLSGLPAPITAANVGEAALQGDPLSVRLMGESATIVGEMLASLVNFFNPSLILLGGRVAESGDLYLARVREMIFGRSLPLATRWLRIERSPLGHRAGLKGAAFMALDELFSAEHFHTWHEHGSPVGVLKLSGG